MVPELGGSQISALLESVPGIASVLRSPVADALVNMIRAGAGLGDFSVDDARELVDYAVRRGLISSDEGDQLMHEVSAAARGRKGKAKAKRTKAAKKTGGKKSPAKKAARSPKKKRAASRVRKSANSKRVKRR